MLVGQRRDENKGTVPMHMSERESKETWGGVRIPLYAHGSSLLPTASSVHSFRDAGLL